MPPIDPDPQQQLSPSARAAGPDPLLVLILGPTGSGKTALSLQLALRFSGEILSCDSVAVYRGMDAGTAKPSAEERAQAPHHLLDLLDPTEAMTAGDWARAARSTARAVARRGHLPIVSGGTGLYLRALTEGLAPLPPRCPAVRERLVASAHGRPPGYLHRLLTRLDQAAAARIHPNDEPKLIRAIEVALLAPGPITSGPITSGPISVGGRDPLTGFRLLRLGLDPPRAELYARLDRRAAAMFDNGLLDETRRLQQVHGTSAQALNALGYREAAAVLAGSMSLPDAVAATRQGHRNYAKRQLTWFRREPEVNWFPDFGDSPASLEKMTALITQALR